MSAHRLCVGLVLIAFAVPAFGEPKAYELVRYRGKAAGLTIAFDFANGYPEASEIRITKAGARQSRKFHLADSGEMRFVPVTGRDRGDGVILKMTAFEQPEKVEGVYRVEGKTIPFTLTER
jgi:hypothetical protein